MKLLSRLWPGASAAEQNPPAPTPAGLFDAVPDEVWARHLIYRHLIDDARTLTTFGQLNRATRNLVFQDCRDAWTHAARRTVPWAPTVLWDHDASTDATRRSETQMLHEQLGHYVRASANLRAKRPPTILSDGIEDCGHFVFSPDGRFALGRRLAGAEQNILFDAHRRTCKQLCSGGYETYSFQPEQWSPDSRFYVTQVHSGTAGTRAVCAAASGALAAEIYDATRFRGWSPLAHRMLLSEHPLRRSEVIVNTASFYGSELEASFTRRTLAQDVGFPTAPVWNFSGSLFALASTTGVMINDDQGHLLHHDTQNPIRAPQVLWRDDYTLLSMRQGTSSTHVARFYDLRDVASGVKSYDKPVDMPGGISHARSDDHRHIAYWGGQCVHILSLQPWTQKAFTVGDVEAACWSPRNVFAVAHATDTGQRLVQLMWPHGATQLLTDTPLPVRVRQLHWFVQGDMLLVHWRRHDLDSHDTVDVTGYWVDDKRKALSWRKLESSTLCVSPDGTGAFFARYDAREDRQRYTWLSYV